MSNISPTVPAAITASQLADIFMSRFTATLFADTSDKRGTYGEIVSISGPLTTKQIMAFVATTLPAHVCEFDRKGRGDAVNSELYGWCAQELVAVVQIRHAYRKRAGHYMRVHKTYVLCGFNENGTPFRHPVSAAAVHGAIRSGGSPRDVVKAAQRWMWQVTPDQLALGFRQGDVLLVVERGQPKGELVECGTSARLADTHEVTADRLVTDAKGKLWAIRPVLRHLKGEHRDESSYRGTWISVRVARTASAWDFGQRLGD